MNAAVNTIDGIHVRGFTMCRRRTSSTIWAAAIAPSSAAALYLVDAASPAALPDNANHRMARSPDSASSAARTSSASETVTSSVISTSVIAKCESLTCRIATVRNAAARNPVVASAIRRPRA